jgi:bifunctional non-homologous end joining protein LigD
MADGLKKYKSKRDFSLTPEPAAGGDASPDALQFVIQKHWASRLHYDFRLELQGTMKSWAVPKGPSFDPAVKRMAVHVEDHPISYNQFEGQIPEKQYGAGKVIIWDRGVWTPLEDPVAGYKKGMLKFTLTGHKMKGAWALIRIKSREKEQKTWLLIKEKDAFTRASSQFSVVDEMPDSVARLPARSAAGVKGTLPKEFKPELATLVDTPPARPDEWIYEVKFDGYRILARLDGKRVSLITRNGHDWTSRLRHLAAALESMKLKSGWLDGEIVLTEGGKTSFQALQNAFESEKTADISYFLFDLPWYDGRDLTDVPLVERRALLETLLADAPQGIRFSQAFEAEPKDLVSSACKLGLEGIIGKRKDSAYSSRRSPDWIKLKCGHRQEFVIGGWTDPKGSRSGLGSLLLGVYDDKKKLVYAGKVGSGFDDRSLKQVSAKLSAVAAKDSPFSTSSPEMRGAHWVRPGLVAEVTFSEWTGGGHLRHPVFHALRTDKPAKSIVRELPVAPLGPDMEEPASALPARLHVSSPERVVDTTTGTTKIQIIRFYGLVGKLMMPHLKDRPVSLVKAPQGIKGAMFFQKHSGKAPMEGVVSLPKRLDPEHPPYLEIAEPLGLLSAAQMNVIEFHTWNATRDDSNRPDRMTFDLDPGAGVEWSSMQQAAQLMQGFLTELGLPAFLKTSGGKGLHVVTPIKPKHDWDTVKDFSEAIVVHMAEALPQLFVAKSGPKNRVGKIFIDYLRNGFGATTVAAWSLRARPGLGVSVPLAWEELKKLKSSAQWTVANIHDRLDVGNTPWGKYAKSGVDISKAMKQLGK